MKESYLERHLEPPVTPDFKEKARDLSKAKEMFPENLRKPFDPEVKYGAKGREVVELKNGWTLEYAYESISESDVQDYSRKWERSAPKYVEDLKAGRFRRLTGLRFQGEDGNYVNILSRFRYPTVFFTEDDMALEESAANPISRNVVSYIPPNSVLGLMAIAHELGHIASAKADPKRIKELRAAPGTMIKGFILHSFLGKASKEKVEQAAAVVLRDERDAWANALAALREVMGAFDVTKEDIAAVIHGVNLALYSEGIRKVQSGLTLQDALAFAGQFLKKIVGGQKEKS